MDARKLLSSFPGKILTQGFWGKNRFGIINSVKEGEKPHHVHLGFCSVCGGMQENPDICDLKLTEFKKLIGKDLDEMGNNLKRIHSTHRIICSECFDQSKKLISEVDNLSLEELPLLLNNSNEFVVERVKERLRKG